MSCILRIAGESLGIDSFLLQNALRVDRSWRKGDPRILKNRLHEHSGANFVVSDADLDDFAGQLADACAYLELHALMIAKLAAFPGVQEAYLDFAVALNDGFVSQTSYLPAAFVRAAGVAGIGIAISHYACREDDA